eukprot:EG_transcript_13024
MDRYDLLRVIGRGAGGACHLARERATGRTVVLKVVPPPPAADRACRDPMQEVRVHSTMAHPNIIKLYDYFFSPDEELCIVLEYADGGDLDALLHSCRRVGKLLDEETVLDWFLQLCLAVHYCHRQNLIHRDLKLQNIFITSTGVVKLGDFGVSREVAPSPDLAMTIIGTPFYLSPEVLKSRPYDVKSDVWALGVVLYELLSLRRPFQARDIAQLKSEVLALRYDPLPKCFSVDLCTLVTSMLQLDPSKRPTVEGLLHSRVLRRRQRQWLQGGEGLRVPEEYVRTVCEMGLLSVAGRPPNPTADRRWKVATGWEAAAAAALAPRRQPSPERRYREGPRTAKIAPADPKGVLDDASSEPDVIVLSEAKLEDCLALVEPPNPGLAGPPVRTGRLSSLVFQGTLPRIHPQTFLTPPTSARLPTQRPTSCASEDNGSVGCASSGSSGAG